MEQTEKIIQIALAFVVFGSLAIGIVSMLVGKLVDWYDAWWQREAQRTEARKQQTTVKSSPIIAVNLGPRYVEEEDEEDRPVSRPSEPSAPSVLRTDGDQRLTKEAVLDICKHLRARGYSRDAARELFTLMGAAFSNDIWTKAAPPERKDEYITPFAGRVTDKKYYPDNPDLEYAPPSS